MIVLSGRRGGTTHRAVELLAALPADLRLIGGLAVMCRVGVPHRTTVDLDALARNLAQVHPAIARLALSAPGGGQYRFADNFDLDVIDVAPSSTAELIEQLNVHAEPFGDLELNVIAHTWSYEHATPLELVAVEEGTKTLLARAVDRLVATSSGLVAMKATTIPLRSSSRPEKRASDLYDLGRLLTLRDVQARDLAAMPDELSEPVIKRITHWFCDPGGRDRTYREVRRFDQPRLDLDEVADAVEAMTA